MRDDELGQMWAVALATLFITSAALWITEVRVYPGPKGTVLSWCAGVWLFISFTFRPRRQWLQNIILLGNGLLLLSAISLCGALLSYLVVRITPFSFADPLLHRVDLSLSFDWLTLYEMYQQHATVTFVMQRMYLAIMDIPTFILLGLALTGQERKLRDFILVFSIALAITLAIFLFLPAITPLFYLAGETPSYISVTGIAFLSTINDLRSGIPFQIELHRLYGLITFPSFHAVCAVVFTWAAWSIRVYRWPIAFLNLGMFLATLLEGTHYLIDLIGGVIVAFTAILSLRLFGQRRLSPKLVAARPGLGGSISLFLSDRGLQNQG